MGFSLPTGVSVSWQSVLGIGYYVQRSANLNLDGAFLTIGTNIAGQASATSFTDINAPFGTQLFYRVGVK